MQTTMQMTTEDRSLATAASDLLNTTNAPLEPYSFVGDDQKMQVIDLYPGCRCCATPVLSRPCVVAIVTAGTLRFHRHRVIALLLGHPASGGQHGSALSRADRALGLLDPLHSGVRLIWSAICAGS